MNFTQSYEYGAWQEKMGRKVFRLNIEDKAVLQAVLYPLVGKKSYLYIPHGPVLTESLNAHDAKSIQTTLLALCKKENAAFCRFDIDPLCHDEKLLKKYFKKSPFSSYFGAYFQSKYDWVLDITPNEDALLIDMHPKTRYSITLAYKKGIIYRTITGKEMLVYFEKFYELMKVTAERGKFSLHPKNYYKAMFEDAEINNTLALYVAEFEGETIAMHFVIFYDETAFYPFGASADKERNRMPTYGLHWNAIQDAKKRGCKYYNFGAIEASDIIAHDNWQGISAFKRKWGGSLLEYSDFYDVVSQPFWYHLYNLRKWMKRIFKR
ncbi:MAG: peptidoglycan bridge formation glycyltransferase FemA/FemB family protein [Candidatus Taylorbacteria bacterium]|nr:peptidoglycan bridge formation glycyltransferase FemA/FemB family protein [Candidatus Taylorbacteria bacterium]